MPKHSDGGRSAAAGEPEDKVVGDGDKAEVRGRFGPGAGAVPTEAHEFAPRHEFAPKVVQADSLNFLRATPAESFELIYVDPPFNSGRKQESVRLRTKLDSDGDRNGFGQNRYQSEVMSRMAYEDSRGGDYLDFLGLRLEEARRVLTAKGSLFVHLDAREVHYAKVLLDQIFGRDCFQNEIIWAYDYGGRSRRRWPSKHDSILWYSCHPRHYTFRYDDIDRIPYMAPGLVGKEKAERGKTPTDVWWQTIVPTAGRERTGYPSQKPLAILRRIVRVHSNPGERVLDFFAGSGTTGEAACSLERHSVLVDESSTAVEVMQQRFASFSSSRGAEPALPRQGAKPKPPAAASEATAQKDSPASSPDSSSRT